MSNRKKKKPVPHYSYDNAAHVTIDNWANRNKQVNANQYNKAVSKFRRQYASAPQHWNTFVKQSNAVQQAGMDNYNASQGDALRMSVQSRIDNATQGRGAALGVRNAPDGPQMASMGTVNGQNIVALPEPVKAEETPLTWFLTSLGSGYMHMNHDMTHPLTALFLAANPIYGQNHGGGFNWSQAWHDTSAKDFRSLQPKNLDGGDAVSLGQALVSNPLLGGEEQRYQGLTQARNNVSNNQNQQMLGKGDPTSVDFKAEQARQADNAPELLGQKLTAYNVTTGLVDTAQQSVGDGLALLTGALKGARAAARITPAAKGSLLGTKTAEQATVENLAKMRNLFEAGRDGVSDNALSRLSGWIANTKSEEAITKRAQEMNLNIPEGVASQLKQANGDREWIDELLLASANDPTAIAKLKAGRPADYAQFVKRDEQLQAKLVANSVYVPGGNIPDGMVASDGRLIAVKGGASRESASGFGAAGPTRYMRDSTSGKLVPVVPEPDLFLGKIRNKAADITHIDRLAEAPKDPVMSVPKVGDNFLTDTGKLYHADTGYAPTFARLMRDDPQWREGYIRARANADPELAQSLHLGTNAELDVIGTGAKGIYGSKIPGWWRIQSKASEKIAEASGRNTFRFAADRGPGLTGGNDSTYGTVSYHQGGLSDYLVAVQRWSLREKPKGIIINKGVGRDDAIPEFVAHVNSIPAFRTAEDGVWKSEWRSRLARNLHSPEGIKATMDAFETDAVQRLAERYAPKFLEKQGLKVGDEGYDAALKAFTEDKVRATEILQAQSRGAVSDFVNEGGYLWDTQSDSMYLSPQLANQLQTGRPLLPLKLLDEQMKQAVTGDGTWVSKSLHKTGDTAYALNEGFQAVWRPLTLLRAAYPIRNTIEGFSRVLSFVGAHAVMNSMAETGEAAVVNAGRKIGRGIKARRATEALTADAQVVANRRIALEAAYRELDDLAPGSAEHLARAEDIYSITNSLDDEMNKLLASESKLTKAVSYKHMGQGTGGAFHTKAGEAAWLRAGNQATWDRMSLATTDARQLKMRNRMLVTNTKITMDDGAETYARAADKYVNHVLVGNRVTQMRLDPAVTSDDFYKWFIGSKDARNELAAHQALGLDVFNEDGVKAWFEDGRANLMQQFPDPQMRDMIRKAGTPGGVQGPIGAGTIRSFVEQYKDVLPPINGDKIVMQDGATRSGRRWMKDFVGKMFHAVGSMPEQNLVRGPYYQARWSEYLDQIGHTLPKDAGDDAWGKAYMEAHRYATRKMNKDLYTIVRQKNLTGLVEHVSPFWTAQINTLTTWPRILWENPKAIAGIAKAYVRAREGGFVDDQGWFHPVPGLKIGDGPGALDIKVPFSNVLSVFAGNLNTETADLISQATGEPTGDRGGMLGGFLSSIFPSPGPIMSVAGSLAQNHELLRKMGVPDSIADSTYRWLNNYGPSDDGRIWDKLVPGYVRTFYDALDTSSQAATTTQVQIFQVEYEKYQMGLRKDPPTPEEVVAKARTTMLFLAAGQWALPGSPRKISPLQPMLAQWWEMQKQYGSTEAHARWNDMYGDDFLAVTSLTGTNKITGLQPNNASWRALRDNPELVSKIINSTGDPGTVQMLMGAQGYSQTDSKEYNTARRMMMNYTVDAAGSKAIVGRTPEEMASQLKMSESWRTFREKVTIPLDAQKRILRQQFGSYANVPSKLKEDMTKYREAQVKQIGKDNPKWAAEWNEGPKKGRTAIKALTTITSDAKFMKQNGDDPYWVAVKRFLEARKTVESAVGGKIPKYGAQTPKETIKAIEKSSKAKGYSFSAESTAKFRQGIRDKAGKVGSEQWKQWQMAKYEAEVDRLRRNVKFADMHDSWFSNEGFDPNRFS